MKSWILPASLVFGLSVAANSALAGPYCSTIGSRDCGDCTVNVTMSVVNANVPRPANFPANRRQGWCPFHWRMPKLTFDVVQQPRHGKIRMNDDTIGYRSSISGPDMFTIKQTWLDRFSLPKTSTVIYNVTVVDGPM